MPCQRFATSVVHLAHCTLLCLASAAHAELLSFSAVRDSSLPLSEHDGGAFSYTQSQRLLDGSTSDVAIPSGEAKAYSEMGVNRVLVHNRAAVDDEYLREYSVGGPFSVGVSAWADRFTVLSDKGVGQLSVSVTITGSFGPGFGSQGAYYLFVASPDQVAQLMEQPFEFLQRSDLLTRAALSLNQHVLAPGYYDDGESLQPNSPFGRTLNGSVDFVDGEPFYLVSVLAGYANDFGSLDAFHSAHFGITAPAGALLSSASGVHYAAAVPEPAALLLWCLGLPLAWLGVRHRS